MAIKVRYSFFAYDNGEEIEHVSRADHVNTIDEAEDKAKSFVRSYYSQADAMTIQFNQKFLTIGGWIIIGTSDIDPDMAFLLVINRLPDQV